MVELRKWEMNALSNSLKGKSKGKMDDDEQILFARWELLKSQDPLVNAIQAGDISLIRAFFKAQERVPSDSLADILFASIEDGREDLVSELLKCKHPIHPKLLEEAHQLAISEGQTKIAALIMSK
jgi:hypothetical protein